MSEPNVGTILEVSTASPKWNIFLSHASEDKDAFARPLYERLTAMGLRVWFDEAEMLLGDSVTRKISDGLKESEFGVLLISQKYLSKGNWTDKEFQAIHTLENTARKKILPILIDVTPTELARLAPLLADKLSIGFSQGLEAVLAAISRAVHEKSLQLNPSNQLTPRPAQRTNHADLQASFSPTIARHYCIDSVSDSESLDNMETLLARGGNAYILISQAPAENNLDTFSLPRKLHIGHFLMARIVNALAAALPEGQTGSIVLPPYKYFERASFFGSEAETYTLELRNVWERLTGQPTLELNHRAICTSYDCSREIEAKVEKITGVLFAVSQAITFSTANAIELLSWRQGSLAPLGSATLLNVAEDTREALGKHGNFRSTTIRSLLSIAYIVRFKSVDYGPSEWVRFIFHLATAQNFDYLLEADKNRYVWDAASALLLNLVEDLLPPRIFLKSLNSLEGTPMKASLSSRITVDKLNDSQFLASLPSHYMQYLSARFLIPVDAPLIDYLSSAAKQVTHRKA